ncbi:MAG: DUF3754 domain-containing protein [Ketobacter sp.]|nr:MAG: DUF3754 domain-containing protein [Ketobacter sp.]
MKDTVSVSGYRFIPYKMHDLIEMCIQESKLGAQQDQFRQLFTILVSVFHFEFHEKLSALKKAYAPFDPDADTRSVPGLQQATPDRFIQTLQQLLEKANYEQITESDLNHALTQHSLFKVQLKVDFSDFSEVLLFCRGQSTKREQVKQWLGLRSKTIEFLNYERVVVYLRTKADFDPEKSGWTDGKPDAMLLRLFQNVPRSDIEMLFPNTHVQMRTIDKLLIGIPAVISGGIVLTTKLGATLLLLGSLIGFWIGLSAEPVELNKASMTVLFAGVGALAGYLWKQFNSFKNRKLRFMQMLTKNLYFKNLDNNAGVFHRLVDDAEEEEGKEALLAYYILLTSGAALTQAELDARVEDWMLSKWDCVINFEIDDALHKLLRFGLVYDDQGCFRAVSIDEAVSRLDQRWDAYFSPSV